MSSTYNNDSPLSITASISGILTFVVAILAALYVRFTYLRNADQEYFQVKTSLSWYKTESTFMQDLISTTDLSLTSNHRESVLPSTQGGEKEKEKEMYSFVLDQLGKLEERLLECLAEAEQGVDMGDIRLGKKEGWTIVPRRMRGRTDIAVKWLPVRAKALELVRQRDALGSRVLFAQMSLISSRVRDLDAQAKQREERQQERLERLESSVFTQHEKLDRLEDLVYRIMHRDRVGIDNHRESDAQKRNHDKRAKPFTRSETENTLPVPQHERDDVEETDTDSVILNPSHTTGTLHTIPSV